MCAILDANVKHELASRQGQAGASFYDWLLAGHGRIVIGGTKLKAELYAGSESGDNRLISELRRAGRISEYDDNPVDSRADDLRGEGVCGSDDHHIIALAQISGARLLYTNDRRLQKDFKNRTLVNRPRGKIYTTVQTKNTTNVHRRLLNDRNLCRV